MISGVRTNSFLLRWKNPHLYAMLLGDVFCFTGALVLAYLLRFDFELFPHQSEQLVSTLYVVIPLKTLIFYMFHLYRGMWRYSSLTDLRRLAQASLLSTLLLVLFLFGGGQKASRSIVLLDAILTVLFTGGLRLGIRSYYVLTNKISLSSGFGLTSKQKNLKRVLIIGAGDAGEIILREIFSNPQLQYLPVGLLDDDPRKKGRSLHGVPILGNVSDLPCVIERYDIHQVFITIPSASGTEVRRIIEACKSCEAEYKIMPGIEEIIDGNISVKTLRELNYEDLLGRQPVEVDMTGIGHYITGHTIMITGCGGSIGSELCRKVVGFKPGMLILVDAGEANLFHIQMELQHEFGCTSFATVLGHVQDRRLMDSIFSKYRPEVIFHAAACKHVPMLELNPWEATSNNILGSLVVMDMADKYGAERFVLVSTDKAVRPTNVMGASKRVAELLMRSFQVSRTKFMAVRFGNVVGSSGSVIPLFRRQIEYGGPVTVTHPDVTRYFMTIPEAARLILQAGAMGEGGEVFVLKMGTPVRIADVAKDLIRLSGKEPGKDIEIIYTGLRDGEKMTEELITADEGIVGTRHDKIMVLKANGNGNGNGNGNHYGGPPEFHSWIRLNLRALIRLGMNHDGWGIKQKLHELVPEYKPQKTKSLL